MPSTRFFPSFADQNSGSNRKVAAFTAKEQDEARTIAGVSCVGLYYYGARYLDAKYSRWLSTDPAVSDYIPMAPVNDEAKKQNEQLPGMGGVFNVVNFQLYHYAGNNPVKYTDPDGRQSVIPIPYPIPWILPKIGPIAIPGEIVVPPILPNPLIQKGGRYYIEQPWDGDWNHAPSGPDMTDPDSNPLGSDWEPDKESNLKDKTGKHKIFRNKKTGESVRWDEPNGNQKGHWHRLNPNKTTNKKMPYLDPKGNPAERNSPDTQ